MYPEQKNRSIHQQADLQRAEEEEAEEDRDPVEREETLRRESKQRKAEDDAQIQLKRLAERERDDMCEAMWTMNLSHKKRVAAAMARTHDRHLRKEAWLRERERREAAELGVAVPPNAVVAAPSSSAAASASLAASSGDGSSSHWGEPGRVSPVMRQRQKRLREEGSAVAGTSSCAGGAQTASVDSSCAEPVLKKARGEWTAATGTDGGGRSHGGGGGGGVGATSGQGRPGKAAGGGLRFTLKGKARGKSRGRAPPPLPAAMAEAAAIAEAREEKLVAAAAAAKSSDAQPMDIELPKSEPGTTVDSAAAPSSHGIKPKASSSFASGSAGAAGAGPVSPAVVNGVARARLSCSRPLLASDGQASGVKLQRAICSDPRLVKMHWDDGLVLVTAVVRDASGGKGLPGIGLTQSPAQLVIEALGIKITIAAPPEARNGEGFAAACGEGAAGVNSVRELRENVRKLDGHIEEHARGGDESLRWVDNLREKREVLRQVGGLLEDDDFRYLPALGGLWMAAYHRPSAAARNGSGGAWKTGSATPCIEFRVLMRRARLASEGGLTVEEDGKYAQEAAAAAAAAAAPAAVVVAAEGSGDEEGGGGAYISTPMDHLRALEEQIYDDQVGEVVSGVVDGMVQKVMVRGLKEADLQEVVRWQAEEDGRSLAKTSIRGVEKPSSRILDL